VLAAIGLHSVAIVTSLLLSPTTASTVTVLVLLMVLEVLVHVLCICYKGAHNVLLLCVILLLRAFC
jgi:hypothetical protein